VLPLSPWRCLSCIAWLPYAHAYTSTPGRSAGLCDRSTLHDVRRQRKRADALLSTVPSLLSHEESGSQRLHDAHPYTTLAINLRCSQAPRDRRYPPGRGRLCYDTQEPAPQMRGIAQPTVSKFDCSDL